MDFYLRLAKKEDDAQLEGMVLFEDLEEPLELGTGRTEYKHFIFDDYSYYVADMYDIFEEIAEILPDARICYQSAQHKSAGAIDSMLKKENDNKIYIAHDWGIEYSSNWDGSYDDERKWDVIGSDKWCDLVVDLCENAGCGIIEELDFWEDEDEDDE